MKGKKKLNNPVRQSAERCLIKCLANRIDNKLKLRAVRVDFTEIPAKILK